MPNRCPHTAVIIALIVACVTVAELAAPARALPADSLEAGEVAALVIVPAGLVLIGMDIFDDRSDLPPSWTEPPGIDRWVATHLAPAPRSSRANFMDSGAAAAINVVAMGAAVGYLDATYPVDSPGHDFAEGQLLYWSGLASLTGVQYAVKGLVGRQRPLWWLAPDLAAQRSGASRSTERQSFWSGHASSAFYAATFLNLRARDAMRRELAPDDFDDWAWAPPAVLFTWATWVAYSRIHAHQHYLTDVLVGAGVGTALALLFESFGESSDANEPSGGKTAIPLISFGMRF